MKNKAVEPVAWMFDNDNSTITSDYNHICALHHVNHRKINSLYPAEALLAKDKQIKELEKQIETINDMIGESESGETITTGGNIPDEVLDYGEEITKENVALKKQIEEIKTAFQLEEIRTKRIVLDYQSKLDELKKENDELEKQIETNLNDEPMHMNWKRAMELYNKTKPSVSLPEQKSERKNKMAKLNEELRESRKRGHDV